MKKLILLITLLNLLAGCDKQITISIPTIITNSNSESIGEEMLFEVIEYAEIDGDKVSAESYYWEITKNPTNSTFTPDSTYDNKMVWIPLEEGKYIISITILYDGNKSIKAFKEVEITISASYFQKKLAGTWVGKLILNDIYLAGEISLQIDEFGHFTGSNISGTAQSCMYWGTNIDMECATIIIEELQENKGKGEVSIPFSGGYCCDFELDDFEFHNNYDSLVFQVNGSPACNFDGSIRQYLKRQ